MLVDVITIAVSMVGALWMRFDFHYSIIEPVFLETIYCYMAINILCTLLIYTLFQLYSSLWRFASIEELEKIIGAILLSTTLQCTGMYVMGLRFPRSYPFLYVVLLGVLTILSRFSYRFMRGTLRDYKNIRNKERVRTMVVGAGAAGNMIVREMKHSKHLHRKILCIIDDDPQKIGSHLQGIPIVGNKESIPHFVKKYGIEEIVIAIPTIKHAKQKELLEICQQTACKTLTLPGIYQLVNEEVEVSMLREVQIEDLLGRPMINLGMNEAMEYIQDKTILVTGGGGSIGSEICRQIALYHPRKLIIFDSYENSAYDIQNELMKNHPDLDLEVLIGSVRNQKRINWIFADYRPDLVFHAAAHKHVPLMEKSPNEAIKNNVLGTWLVARAADQYNAKKMVLISTDKAVRPTNIMGASKRICELVVQSFAQKSKTEYAAVRFGNVLGSNGSVIPLFRKQIAEGGPVTVTHPDIIRYFMTIPEAVDLVLQCGALAKGGEIFILDMGEPVKIVDLARKMIRLSGLIPDEDIKIQFTGLRPGEKLYEELLLNEKHLKQTANDKIFVVQQTEVDDQVIQQKVKQLIAAAFNEGEDVRKLVKEIVPEYNISQ